MGKGRRSLETCLRCSRSRIPDSGIMLWLVKCLHVDRFAALLTVSRSFNVTLLPSRSYHYAPTKRVIKPPNQFIYARNACRVQLRLGLRERVNRNSTEKLRDLLWNLFGCSSPVAGGAFSSETSLFLFAEAGVTLAVYFFSAHISLHCLHDLNSWNRLVLLQFAIKVR